MIASGQCEIEVNVGRSVGRLSGRSVNNLII